MGQDVGYFMACAPPLGSQPNVQCQVEDVAMNRSTLCGLIVVAVMSTNGLALAWPGDDNSTGTPSAGDRVQKSQLQSSNAAQTGADGCYFGECPSRTSSNPGPQLPPPRTSIPAPPLPPSNADVTRIAIRNSCSESIRIAVRYHSIDRVWTTANWYTFRPAEYAALRAVRTSNPNIYFWAEIPGTKYTWSGKDDQSDDRTYTIDGQQYRFRHRIAQKDDDGDWYIRLTCDNRR